MLSAAVLDLAKRMPLCARSPARALLPGALWAMPFPMRAKHPLPAAVPPASGLAGTKPSKGPAMLGSLLKALPPVVLWGLVAAALAAPLLETQGHGVSREFYALLGNICHQLPSRSLFVGDSHLGLCMRCLALYGSMALSAALTLLVRAKPLPGWLLVAGLVPCLIDGFSSNLGLWQSAAPHRLLTGALAGTTIALFAHPRYCRMVDTFVTRLDRPTSRPLGDAT